MSESAWCPVNLSAIATEIPSRGGATMININDVIYLFGGANRGQTNFSDLWVIKEEGGEAKAKCVECEGDVPMPRSDHAVVGYDGKFMLLFGGKNYENEECYNDLYLLDLTSFEWWYVGEAGEEIDVRCGHSLGLLTGPGADAGVTYLVVFGGSSPETGTCSNDTYYAILPSSSSEISVLKDFFVTWQKLAAVGGPEAREMHGTAHFRDQCMYVSGGMSQAQPRGLSDVWRLVATATTLQWERCADIELPTPLFGHCCTVSEDDAGRVLLCSMSGISGGDCIVEDMLCVDITVACAETADGLHRHGAARSTEDSTAAWVASQWRNTPSQPVHFRMGLCFLSGGVPVWLFAHHREALVEGDTQQSARARKNARKKKNRAARAKQSQGGDEAVGESGDDMREEETPDAVSSAADDGVGVVEAMGDAEAAATMPLAAEVNPVPSEVPVAESAMGNCVLLFGGVDQQTDYRDLWLFRCHTHVQVFGDAAATVGAPSASSGLVSVLC